MNKMNKKGFTIVELVIVIAVIAILAGVLIPTFGGIIDRANASAEMQKVAAAYKEAYALAMSDDGKVDGTEDFKTVSKLDTTKKCIAVDVYEFYYGTDWTVKKLVKDGDAYKADETYTYKYDKGAWTVTKKAS